MSESPLQSAVNRIRTVEFFGVLIPGLSMAAGWWLVRASRSSADLQTLGRRVLAAMWTMPGWFGAVVVIFASYLLGSIVRAFPVDFVDGPLGRLLLALGLEHLMYRGDFPYRTMLCHHHEILQDRGCLDQLVCADPMIQAMRLPSKPEAKADRVATHVAFDFWKSWLYACEPSTVLRIQELEGRTRMFSGMLWASAVVFAYALVATAGNPGSMAFVPLIASAVFMVTFGLRLRHVRAEEARQVFFFYLLSRSPKRDPG